MLSSAQIKGMFDAKIEADRRGVDDAHFAASGHQHAALLEMSEMLFHLVAEAENECMQPCSHSSEGLLCMLHYVLCQMLSTCHNDSARAAVLFEAAMHDERGYIEFDSACYAVDGLCTAQALQIQLGLLSVNRYSIALFKRVLAGFGLTLSDMHRLFVAKTILMLFRLDHGYQSGRYVKIWEGREDIAHLTELMCDLDSSRHDYFMQVYGEFQRRYLLSLSGAQKGSYVE